MISARNSMFNTVTEVMAAGPDVVWSLFLDRRLWMESFVSQELLEGKDGEAGALLRVRTRTEGPGGVRMEQVIYARQYRRLVVRIWVEGADMGAHADFQFDPCPEGGCQLQVSIHTWAPGLTADQLGEFEALTQTKIAGDFAKFSALVAERGAASNAGSAHA